jgi:hypothetical protein
VILELAVRQSRKEDHQFSCRVVDVDSYLHLPKHPANIRVPPLRSQALQATKSKVQMQGNAAAKASVAYIRNAITNLIVTTQGIRANLSWVQDVQETLEWELSHHNIIHRSSILNFNIPSILSTETIRNAENMKCNSTLQTMGATDFRLANREMRYSYLFPDKFTGLFKEVEFEMLRNRGDHRL